MYSFPLSSVLVVIGCLCSTSPINSLLATTAPRRFLTTQLYQSGTTTSVAVLGPPLTINEKFTGLQKIHNDPDIYIIENFLDHTSCDDIIEKAKEKKLNQSPVRLSLPPILPPFSHVYFHARLTLPAFLPGCLCWLDHRCERSSIIGCQRSCDLVGNYNRMDPNKG